MSPVVIALWIALPSIIALVVVGLVALAIRLRRRTPPIRRP